jgi:hypothetical protein
MLILFVQMCLGMAGARVGDVSGYGRSALRRTEFVRATAAATTITTTTTTSSIEQ